MNEIMNNYMAKCGKFDELMHCLKEDNVDAAEELCCELFIKDDGTPDYDNIYMAHKFYNILVTPGETDSFGWLTGVCRLADGTGSEVVFG